MTPYESRALNYAHRADWHGGYAATAVSLALDLTRFPLEETSMVSLAYNDARDAAHFGLLALEMRESALIWRIEPCTR